VVGSTVRTFTKLGKCVKKSDYTVDKQIQTYMKSERIKGTVVVNPLRVIGEKMNPSDLALTTRSVLGKKRCMFGIWH